MSWSVSLMLPLAAMAIGGDMPSDADTDSVSERFARVLVTSYVCETLGYGVNYEGLADWGHAIAAQMESDGATPEAAMAHIRSDVRNARDRFHLIHGQTLRTAALAGPGRLGGDEAQYRFQHRFTKRCNDLVAAPDIGALFTAPEQRLSGAAFSRKTESLYRGRFGGG
jgi:hypothetical protein